MASEETRPRYLGELGVLARRARLMNRAIGPLFVAAMLALFSGLLMFLGEIQLAMTGLRIGPP